MMRACNVASHDQAVTDSTQNLEKRLKMQTETITSEQVLELAAAMPREQLAQWYAYGISISSSMTTAPQKETDLQQEFAMWEAASDEDWLKVESQLTEGA